jgi:hypothetical protein
MLSVETVAVYYENRMKQTHSVGKMQSFNVLKRVVYIVTIGF